LIIRNNIILAQEITHSFALKSWKQQAFLLKIDLAKIFDRLEWNFIVSALRRKELEGHFINLVYACISSPRFSIISNRGIRQGCPLSPYLFVRAINELSLSLHDAIIQNQLSGVSLGRNCPPIHYMLFADDLLICGNATVQEANQLDHPINHFCSQPG
jgi:hypothetical protein